jgi:putative SOS response-associated peptidase YedK
MSISSRKLRAGRGISPAEIRDSIEGVEEMCGRFQASRSAEEIARWFKTTGPLPNTRERYNAAPTQSLLNVLRDPDTGERQLAVLRWGLIPFWAKDAKIAYSTINAMAETVATKPAFREAFKSRRCLVPADGFYEWKKLDAKNKQPYRFVLADESLMGFAGLWERWKDPASGETVRSFTIVTGAPNPLGEPIHDRMPVILDPADYARWLGEEPASRDELLGLLRPYPAERMRVHPIGPAIGNVKHEGPELIEPAGPDLAIAV